MAVLVDVSSILVQTKIYLQNYWMDYKWTLVTPEIHLQANVVDCSFSSRKP